MSNSNIPSNILDGIYVFTNLYVNKFSNVYFTTQLGGNHMIYNNDNINNLPVAIIGGGPVGLSAASHLVSRNQPFILFESGEQVGTSFLDYGHVRLFSPWEYKDRKSTRLNSSHVAISYAVFCLK